MNMYYLGTTFEKGDLSLFSKFIHYEPDDKYYLCMKSSFQSWSVEIIVIWKNNICWPNRKHQ